MKRAKRIIWAVVLVLFLLINGFGFFYLTRFQTVSSLKKVSAYDSKYDLYEMDVKYAYDLDQVIEEGITDNQSFIDAIVKESLPLLPVHIKAPDFGCSVFGIKDTSGNQLMGRNYDFSRNTSALLVRCHPKNGYRSIAFAALDNLSANEATKSIKTKLTCLTAPFVCLDGLNEKGVAIAVLTLDSTPTIQQTGKPVIATTLAIRLVLDQAKSTDDAVNLLKKYDMFASSGRDYHFYISDAKGDSRIVEYDCENEERPLIDTKVRTATNFFEIYKDQVKPNQKNGIYGHGKERYEIIEQILDKKEGNYTKKVAWKALKKASQVPKPGDVTSNTQWSIVYDKTNLSAQVVIRRDWNHRYQYKLQ